MRITVRLVHLCDPNLCNSQEGHSGNSFGRRVSNAKEEVDWLALFGQLVQRGTLDRPRNSEHPASRSSYRVCKRLQTAFVSGAWGAWHRLG